MKALIQASLTLNMLAHFWVAKEMRGDHETVHIVYASSGVNLADAFYRQDMNGEPSSTVKVDMI